MTFLAIYEVAKTFPVCFLQIISRATNLDVQRWGCELLRSLSQPV